MRERSFNHMQFQQVAQRGVSFMSRASLPATLRPELDNLSAQEARNYLAQRKVFDRELLQPTNEIRKLAAECEG